MLSKDSILIPGVLLIERLLHPVIDNRIRRSPDDNPALLPCGVVKFFDSFAAAFALFLSVASPVQSHQHRNCIQPINSLSFMPAASFDQQAAVLRCAILFSNLLVQQQRLRS